MYEFDDIFTDDNVANEGIFSTLFGSKKKASKEPEKPQIKYLNSDEETQFNEACKFCVSSIKKHAASVASNAGCSKSVFGKISAIDTTGGLYKKGYYCPLFISAPEFYKNYDEWKSLADDNNDPIWHAYGAMTDRINDDISHSKFAGLIHADRDGCTDEYLISLQWDSTNPVTESTNLNGNMFDDIFTDAADESVATNLRRDLQDDPEEAMSLKSMYNVYMNADALAKYEDKYDQLKHINKNAENLRGHMYFMNGELVAFISVEYKSGKTWIDTLEVVKKFRGNKLSFQLLDVAVRKFHATDLRVNKENEKAIGIFKTYGFKTYDHKGNWLYMSLRADVKEIENKETEKAQPITDNLKSDMIKDAKQRTANESAMDDGFDEFLAMCLEAANGVKSVEDLLDEAKGTLNKKLKTVEDCDAYLEVIKNESAKFNEACSCLVSAYAKYNHGKKERADKVELTKTTSAAIGLLRQNCKRLNVSLGDIAHSEGKEISRNDIKRFGQYVAGLRKITNEIKEARKKGVALEFAEPAEEIEDADIALESIDAANEFFDMMRSANAATDIDHDVDTDFDSWTNFDE